MVLKEALGGFKSGWAGSRENEEGANFGSPNCRLCHWRVVQVTRGCYRVEGVLRSLARVLSICEI